MRKHLKALKHILLGPHRVCITVFTFHDILDSELRLSPVFSGIEELRPRSPEKGKRPNDGRDGRTIASSASASSSSPSPSPSPFPSPSPSPPPSFVAISPPASSSSSASSVSVRLTPTSASSPAFFEIIDIFCSIALSIGKNWKESMAKKNRIWSVMKVERRPERQDYPKPKSLPCFISFKILLHLSTIVSSGFKIYDTGNGKSEVNRSSKKHKKELIDKPGFYCSSSCCIWYSRDAFGLDPLEHFASASLAFVDRVAVLDTGNRFVIVHREKRELKRWDSSHHHALRRLLSPSWMRRSRSRIMALVAGERWGGATCLASSADFWAFLLSETIAFACSSTGAARWVWGESAMRFFSALVDSRRIEKSQIRNVVREGKVEKEAIKSSWRQEALLTRSRKEEGWQAADASCFIDCDSPSHGCFSFSGKLASFGLSLFLSSSL